ncbi:MAG: FHA domain-containing protein [Bdellovibrionaceae bacterium]|nr:FHA domain-containing protein [Pseudobdellovibrionaceae bacterium]
MWALRILNGPQAGQIFPLEPGKLKLGRAQSCQIQLNAAGISKEHFEVSVLPDKVLITDLRSSNGTFLNGVRIQGGFLNIGDKVMVNQVILDVVLMQERPQGQTLRPVDSNLPVPMGSGVPQIGGQPPGGMVPGTPMGQDGFGHYNNGVVPSPVVHRPPASFGGFLEYKSYQFNEYMDTTVLPGVYKLPQTFEFRFVLMGFVGVFILAVTLLSMIPLYQVTSESVNIESQRRALTVARALSEINQRVLRSGDFSGFRTDMVMKEEGIEDAYVVAADGKILAPPERVGLTPKEAGFMSKIKRSTQEMTDSSLDGRVVASVPVVAFDAELQQNVAKAYAVIVYNPGNLTFDDQRAFSLFVQVFTLAIIVGAALFFFLYKMIQYPYARLHMALDEAMRDGNDQIQIEFQFAALQNLMTSINSLLARVAAGNQNEHMSVGKGSRDGEIANLMQLIGYPSILISREGMIARVSPTFSQLTQIAEERLVGAKINDIPDPAMQQNFNHLMSQSQMNMSSISSDTLDIGGHNFMLNCQALANAQGDIEYFLITVTPVEGQEGAA